MAALLSLEEAKDHLYVVDSVYDNEIERKVEEASETIVDRCNSTAWWRAITPTWTVDTVPGSVKSAIKLLLGHLWKHRGDNMAPDKDLWDAVDRMIALKKDPVIA
jgi:hypothetical protein